MDRRLPALGRIGVDDVTTAGTDRTILIRCGRLIDGTGGPTLEDAAVLIVGNTIQAVQPFDVQSATTTDEYHDYSDMTVAPGFVDAHVHLTFSHQPTHASTRALVEESSLGQLFDIGAANAAECLLGGVTSARDCGDREFVTVELRDSINDGRLPGPRLLAAGPPLTVPGGHLHWCGTVVETAAAVRAAVQDHCRRGVDAIKVMASGGNMTEGSDVYGSQFEQAALAAAVEEAHRHSRRVAAHALSQASIRAAVDAGVDTIEHCSWLLPDGSQQLDTDTVSRMADAPLSVTLTMAGIARALLPGQDLPPADRQTARTLSRTGSLAGDHWWAREMLGAGVRLTIASDAGVRFTPFREFPSSIECGVEALGIPLRQAISMATRSAAESIGIGEIVGTIGGGMRADLVVTEGLVEESSPRLGPIATVWQNGIVVADHGVVRQNAQAPLRPAKPVS